MLDPENGEGVVTIVRVYFPAGNASTGSPGPEPPSELPKERLLTGVPSGPLSDQEMLLWRARTSK
jgi:hypothetical protein